MPMHETRLNYYRIDKMPLVIFVFFLIHSNFAESSPISKPLQDLDSFAPGLRIFGGRGAEPYSAPFMVYLRSSDLAWFVLVKTTLCGATLISNNYILSAAHCLRNKEHTYTAFFGSHTEPQAGQISRSIVQIIIHKDFRMEETLFGGYVKRMDNDVGVARLDRPITFTSHISPVRLPPINDRTNYFHKIGKIYGWGKIERNEFSLSNATQLREADVLVLSYEECDAQIPLNEKHICATGYQTAAGTCQGDSGGPLLVGDVQIGITSAGSCSVQTSSVFTFVNKYIYWLQENSDL